MAESEGSNDLDLWAQRAWMALEVLHVPPYFSPETAQAATELGLHPKLAYFPWRAAALGAVPAEVVEATFYVFAPRAVRMAVPGCWEIVSPQKVLAARLDAAGGTLHRLLDGALKDGALAAAPAGALDEAVALARRACEGLTSPGRALYAGHAALPWPDDPLLQLWHAATLVREHRGDGHVAALLTAGLSPVEAMWTYALDDQPGGVTLRFLRRSRGWTDDEWSEAADRLVEQDLVAVADGEGVQGSGFELTAAGRTLRSELEDATRLAALEGWAGLGVDGTRRLAVLLKPLRDLVLASDALGPSRR